MNNLRAAACVSAMALQSCSTLLAAKISAAPPNDAIANALVAMSSSCALVMPYYSLCREPPTFCGYRLTAGQEGWPKECPGKDNAVLKLLPRCEQVGRLDTKRRSDEVVEYSTTLSCRFEIVAAGPLEARDWELSAERLDDYVPCTLALQKNARLLNVALPVETSSASK